MKHVKATSPSCSPLSWPILQFKTTKHFLLCTLEPQGQSFTLCSKPKVQHVVIHIMSVARHNTQQHQPPESNCTPRPVWMFSSPPTAREWGERVSLNVPPRRTYIPPVDEGSVALTKNQVAISRATSSALVSNKKSKNNTNTNDTNNTKKNVTFSINNYLKLFIIIYVRLK